VEYAFTVIDPAVAPDDHISPKRKLMVLFGLVIGVCVGCSSHSCTTPWFVTDALRHSLYRVPMLTDEVRYRLLKVIEANPGLSQRQVARALGISLGKVNYCLNALISKGLIKVTNFKNSNNKAAYLYLLTPRGLKEKTRVTGRF